MIKVFDDVLKYSELQGMYTQCKDLEFKMGHGASEDLVVNTERMVSHLDKESFVEGVFGKKVLEIISQNEEIVFQNTDKEKKLTLSDVYVNFYSFSTPTGIHVDSTKQGNLTALFFPNLEWNPQWGGEILFYEDSLLSVKEAICFIPNRLILFDSSIPHCAKQPCITSPVPRFSVAIKFETNND